MGNNKFMYCTEMIQSRLMSFGYYRLGTDITVRWDRLGKGKKLNHTIYLKSN
jgi:hypothetical protein